MTSKAFWVDAGERAIRAFAASLGALLGANVVDLAHTPWPADLSIAGGAGLASLLLSIAASQVGTAQTAAFISALAPKLPAAVAALKAAQAKRQTAAAAPGPDLQDLVRAAAQTTVRPRS